MVYPGAHEDFGDSPSCEELLGADEEELCPRCEGEGTVSCVNPNCPICPDICGLCGGTGIIPK